VTKSVAAGRALDPIGGRERVWSVRRQVGRVIVAVVAAGVVATGCAGPNQAGTAVIIGDRAVPLETVQAQLDVALAKPDQLAVLTQQGGTPADLARGVVTQQVLRELLGREAAAEGITVTDAQIDTELENNGGAAAVLESSFFDEASLRELIRDNLIAAELARREVGGLSVTADLVAATSRADADQKAAALAEGGPAAEALFTGQDPETGTAAKGRVFQAAAQPDAAATVLFGTPIGGVVSFQPNPQNATWIVFKVVERRTDGVVDAAAVDSISQAQLITIGQRLMQPVAEEVGVQVNPRYGVWDPIQLRVVGEDQVTGQILAPAAAG
jgi:hypothetical protein